MGLRGRRDRLNFWRVQTRRLGYLDLVTTGWTVVTAGLIHRWASELDKDNKTAACNLFLADAIFSREAQVFLAPLVPGPPLTWILAGLGILIAVLQLVADAYLITSTKSWLHPLNAAHFARVWWMVTIISTGILGAGGTLVGSALMLRVTLVFVVARGLALYNVRQFMRELAAAMPPPRLCNKCRGKRELPVVTKV